MGLAAIRELRAERQTEAIAATQRREAEGRMLLDGVLARLVTGDLGGEHIQRRPGPRPGGYDRQRREHVQQAVAPADEVFPLPVDHNLRWGGGVIGDRVPAGPADEGDVARGEAYRRVAGIVEPDRRVATERGHDRQWRSVGERQRPRRSLDELPDHSVPGAGPVQHIAEDVHAIAER